MNRSEFLNELRMALQGDISQAKVNENLQYYENYIIEQSRKGKSEAQIIEGLGNPRLIAKTIIDTTDQIYTQEQPYSEGQYDNDGGSTDTRDKHQKGFHINFDENNDWDIRYSRFKINSWYGTLTIILIVVLILFLVANLTLALIPIVLPVLLVLFVIYLIFGNRK